MKKLQVKKNRASLKASDAIPNTSKGTHTGELKTIKLPNLHDQLGYPHNVAALLAAYQFSGDVRTFVVNAIEVADEDQFAIELKHEWNLLVDKPGNTIKLVHDNDVISTLHFSVLGQQLVGSSAD